MALKAISTTYRFACDEGKKLNAEITKNILQGCNLSLGFGYRSVEFTVSDDNDKSKTQEIRRALWYSQREI